MRGRRNAARAFLCYQRGDRRLAVQLASALRLALGDDDAVWYSPDPDFPDEQDYYATIHEILTRPVFLVILTRRALGSEWLRQQMVTAQDNGKHIVLILRQPVQLTGELANFRDNSAAVSALPGTQLESVINTIAARVRGEYPTSTEAVGEIQNRYRRYRVMHLWAPLATLLTMFLILGVVAGPAVVAHAVPFFAGSFGCSMPLTLNLDGKHDLGRGQWWPAGYLQLGRVGDSAITLPNGKVLVEGGAFRQGYSSDFARASELFDPKTCTWQSTGTLHIGRTADATVLLRNGKVLAIGGYDGPVLTDAEIYDPSTGAWSPTGSMAQPRDLMTATLLPDGRVLVVGGWDNTVADSAELYDPTSGRWSWAGHMSIPRTGHVAVLLPSGKVLIAGGEPVNVATTDRAELYTPGSNSWSVTGSMTIPRGGAGAVLLPDGQVLVAGGDTTTGLTATAELYNPASGRWSIAASMHHARGFTHGTLELLPNGTVLAVGGDTQGTSEIYLPGSNTWTEPISIGQPYCGGAAALLHDGRVLLAGGSACQHPDVVPLAAMIYTY